ncbi:MAG: GDSL-type esterase/lipase family protein [Anaerovorax sp.]|nr:GDSL-type esterase/lipase family protein [Anaerovorax sp.]
MKRSIIIGIVAVLLCGLSVFAMGIEKKPMLPEKENKPIEVEKEKKPEEMETKKPSEKVIPEEKSETIPAIKQEEASKLELGEVENSYFSDAVFIGDSRTEGFRLHAGLTEAGYLTAKGLNVKDVFEKPLIKENNGTKTIAQALRERTYQKYYIMLGANELGWVYTDIFTDKYGQIIDLIREVNPNATIYVQSILPVTDEKSQSDAIYNNTNIVRFNELLKALAQEKNAIYLSVNEAVQKEDGALQEEATTDGVHLNKEYCVKWLEYLKKHIDQNELEEGKK